jgi:hypothetical protein
VHEAVPLGARQQGRDGEGERRSEGVGGRGGAVRGAEEASEDLRAIRRERDRAEVDGRQRGQRGGAPGVGVVAGGEQEGAAGGDPVAQGLLLLGLQTRGLGARPDEQVDGGPGEPGFGEIPREQRLDADFAGAFVGDGRVADDGAAADPAHGGPAGGVLADHGDAQGVGVEGARADGEALFVEVAAAGVADDHAQLFGPGGRVDGQDEPPGRVAGGVEVADGGRRRGVAEVDPDFATYRGARVDVEEHR